MNVLEVTVIAVCASFIGACAGFLIAKVWKP